MMQRLAAISLVTLACVAGIGCSNQPGYAVSGGDRKTTARSTLTPKTGNFFEDDAIGRELAAQLEFTADRLGGATKNPKLKGSLGTSVKQYSDLFDKVSMDLRATYQATYHGLVAALSVSKTDEMTLKLQTQYNALVDRAHNRTQSVRAIQENARAVGATPTAEALDGLHKSVIEFIRASANAKETTVDPGRLGRGLSIYLDELAGQNANGAYLWTYRADGGASVLVPIEPTGETRITGWLDKTPFMGHPRTLTCTVLNVDTEGQQAFAAFMKSNILFNIYTLSGEDGNRHTNLSTFVTMKSPVEIAQAGPRDASFYLAWRGVTLSREEFIRRYPFALLRLEVSSISATARNS